MPSCRILDDELCKGFDRVHFPVKVKTVIIAAESSLSNLRVRSPRACPSRSSLETGSRACAGEAVTVVVEGTVVDDELRRRFWRNDT